jgi:tripeptide aminopeptidase
MIHVERLSDEFCKLAAIDSPSLHEGTIARYLQQRFTQLGAKVSVDECATQINGETGNILALFPGNKSSAKPLLLSAHMDTVTPAIGVQPVLADGVFRSAGATILGADDKSGIAQIIEAIQCLQENNIAHPPLEVLITVAEEVGLLGIKHFDMSRLRAKHGLVLDSSGVGTVAVSSPGANKLRFVVEGVATHAGLDPEHGLSAIQVAAKAISKMQLGRIDTETTANIGLISGGQATNIIPNYVQVLGETRSFNAEKLRCQTEHMQQCFQDAVAAQSIIDMHGERRNAQLDIDVVADYPAMKVDPASEMITNLLKAAALVDQQLLVGSSGGGSDANIFNQQGIVVANLATGMQKVHTVDEFIRVDDLAKVCRLLLQFIRIS